MPRKRKYIKVVHRKLGREKRLGQAWVDRRLIELDPRQRSKPYLNSILHELTHCLWPDLPESNVCKAAEQFTKALWEAGFRRIHK